MASIDRRFCTCLLVATLITAVLCGCSEQPRIGRLTVLVSGSVEGYLRNCGCSSGQAGGELRKARIVKMEREEALRPKPADRGLAPAFILLDTGNFSNARNEVTRAEAAGVVKSMAKLDYAAVGIGQQELAYPQKDLLALLGQANLPMTVANLMFVKPNSGEDHSTELNALIKPYKLVKLDNGYTIGLLHVVDLSVQARHGDETGFECTAPEVAAADVLREHAKEADTWILSIANPRNNTEDREKLAEVSGIAVIIGFQRGSPLVDTASQEANSLPRFIAPPFERAKDVVRVTVGYSAQGQIETVVSDEIMIPDTIKPDEYVQSIIDEIQPELERLANKDAEKEDQPGVHPRYVGYSSCASCHPEIVKQLESAKHSIAYETLKEKKEHKSAACLPCHVVGYNKAGGWNILKNTERPEMRGVHCESCHGPGEYHLALMSGEKPPEDLQSGGRNAKGLQTASERTCVVCHDTPNSPNFKFELYWPKIKHGKQE